LMRSTHLAPPFARALNVATALCSVSVWDVLALILGILEPEELTPVILEPVTLEPEELIQETLDLDPLLEVL
jgi:hypothetical protein